MPERPEESPPRTIVDAASGEYCDWPRLAQGPGGRFRALRHRNFQLFLGGQIVSLVGTWMQSTAQAWLVYRLTHSELLLGTTWFCTQIPVFALGPVAGVVADRVSRHRLVLVTQALSMAQALALAALTLGGVVQVWHVLVLAVALGSINAFDMPGRNSLLIEMTGRDDLLNAITLNSTAFNVARVIGPGLAGFLVAAVGEGLCFLLNAVSFLAVIGSLLAMKLAPRAETGEHPSPLDHLVEGFRYAAGNRRVRSVLLLMAATTICGMPVFVLLPFFADDIFHRGSQGLGTLMSVMGCGAAAGVLSLASRTHVRGLERVLAWSAFFLGFAYAAFSRAPWFWSAAVVMAAIGFTVFRQLASANTLIQMVIPDEYRGRIMAMYSMTVVGLGPFGSMAAGALAAWIGARATVSAAGLLCVAAAGVFHFRAARYFHE